VYRVKLPGNPIVGEGKPENQNHAIIFTRGEFLQTIDMNQEAYLEETLKCRQLLQEFDSERQQSIVGFREHIFTGGLSSIANFMALQEGSFVTLGQRILAKPLNLRFHYGHPDVFDKLFFMSRGGVSKASKSINLSEDIFAGFNAVLRGSAGGSSMHEYVQIGKGRDVGMQQLYTFEAKLSAGAAEQTTTRDVYRLGQGLDFFRLLTFYYHGLGFYISNCLTVWAVFLFLYSKLFLVMFHFDTHIVLFRVFVTFRIRISRATGVIFPMSQQGQCFGRPSSSRLCSHRSRRALGC
jgi:callose synthase